VTAAVRVYASVDYRFSYFRLGDEHRPNKRLRGNRPSELLVVDSGQLSSQCVGMLTGNPVTPAAQHPGHTTLAVTCKAHQVGGVNS
jgi:hypothetical protein